MNKIHLNKKSAEDLKKNIDSLIRLGKHFNMELIMHKVYIPLSTCLFNETSLALDMIDLINEYLNDLILLECKASGNTKYNIIIWAKDVTINEEQYNFSYCFDIMEQYVRLHHNISNIYQLVLHQPILFDMIPFFNKYMEEEYYVEDYIKIPNEHQIYDGKWRCEVNKYIMHNQYYNDVVCVSDINREKMKNLIMIYKLVVEHIFSTIKNIISLS